jgi:predicted acyl esterase
MPKPVQVEFSLFPTSFQFLAGQSIELLVGTADHLHFGTEAKKGDQEHKKNITIVQGDAMLCSLQLPVDNNVDVGVEASDNLV